MAKRQNKKWFVVCPISHSANRRLSCPLFSNITHVFDPKRAVNSSDSDVTGDPLWRYLQPFCIFPLKIFTPLIWLHNGNWIEIHTFLKLSWLKILHCFYQRCPLSCCLSFWTLDTEALVSAQGSTHLGWGGRFHLCVSSVCIKL